MTRSALSYDLFFNRETSWLEFNRRVLHEALDASNPLLERAKFIAIFSNNLDEFFMKRVGGLKRQIEGGVTKKTIDGRTPKEQLQAIRPIVMEMVECQRKCLVDDIIPALRKEGVSILNYSELSRHEKKHVDHYFQKAVFPILTPLGVGPGQPFPFLSNLSVSLAVRVRKPNSKTECFARLKVPQNRPRWVATGEPNTFVPLEQLIQANLDNLFPGMEILESRSFRVTRNADIERNEEEAEDLLELIEEELRYRKSAPVVRLEIEQTASSGILDWLMGELGLGDDDVYKLNGPLNLVDLMSLGSLDFPQLKAASWSPITPRKIKELDKDEETRSLFQLMKEGDILLYHPYESFSTSVVRFLQEAATDSQVLAIKQTLYRTADNSPIIAALVEAAQNGKQVAVLVEIKARFDEAQNIQWVRMLESAGVHVTYGFPGIKTHSKTLLVVREEPDGIHRYFHIGTGNYHSGTAKLYTDHGILSCRKDIGEDLTDMFNYLTGHSQQIRYRKILLAPVNMRAHFVRLIKREIEHQKKNGNGRIIAKMNSLEDLEIIKILYQASKAGVQIDLIVRGFCCLRPGLPKISETIRISSIIGRFLEHSRVFYFYNGGKERIFIGSADWMSRNLSYRVEAAVEVEDENIRSQLKEILNIHLSDNCKAWDLQSEGTYVQRKPADGELPRNSQSMFMERASRLNEG
ncbi:MAG: polyphosphate kinase 1 [Candidatus Omnitrophota bacterium]